MKIVSIGGGPAGLYFSLLIKKARPDFQVTVLERNRADDTFGWGVVFSDETLSAFEDADPESFAAITTGFRYWRDIETYYRGECVTSTGHGFAAMSRQQLLLILQERCRELGVELRFEQEVDDFDRLLDEYDLVLGADGINSAVRSRYAEVFQPTLDRRRCKFTWLGTDKPLDAFTFIFEPSEHGLFQVHAYPFAENQGTWIVECHEDVWRRAGLEDASEADTVDFCQELFSDHLGGHRLLTNRSLWRTFQTVRCATWRHRNLVLIGDSAHTAHFSIGSGTKLAMEDSIALAVAVERHAGDTEAALAAYQDARWVDVLKVQKAAQTSLEWFENAARYQDQHPLRFTFNLMSRSKQITYDNLGERDPELIAQVAEQYRVEEGGNLQQDGRAPAPIFTPLQLRDLQLANRVVVSPMCMYSATDGLVDDFHLVHLGSRAQGGAGLVITEMTDVAPEGRITLGCAGLWNDQQQAAWSRITDFVHRHSRAKIGIQLAHAGRKGSTHHPWSGDDVPLTAAEGAWPTLGPSAEPYYPHWPAPKAMDRADMDRVLSDFVAATGRALAADFDLVEVHMAHGYLLSSFLSPLSNQRQDEYGGSFENRSRYPLEVFRAMRAAWPAGRPMAVRISATDWMDDAERGTTAAESVELSRLLAAAGCDLIDVSTAGNSPESDPNYGRMYQVPFAERIRYSVDLPVMAVGAILGADHANTILAAGRADLTAMARPHLRDPYLTAHAAERYGHFEQWWPGQYFHGQPQPPKKEG